MILKQLVAKFLKLSDNVLVPRFTSLVNCSLCIRKGHGCQATLLSLLEDWKLAVDNNEFVAAIIWTHFDYLPHNTLYYYVNYLLMNSYLSNRK